MKGSISASDLTFLRNPYSGSVVIGDTVVLQVGSLTTSFNYSSAAPAAGSYTTFVTNTLGARLSAANGLAIVPEPSTLGLLGVGVPGTSLVALRRRGRLPNAQRNVSTC